MHVRLFAMPDTAQRPPPLAEEQRQLVRDRIRLAAGQALSEHGLAATVEDVAERAGVSVRTVFRHYGTRDHLIGEAIRARFRSYRKHLPRPERAEPLGVWLGRLLAHVHQHHAELGRAYWELTTPGAELGGEIAEAAAKRREARVRLVKWAVSTAWDLTGAAGRPPEWLADAFAIHLSATAVPALVPDFRRTPAQVAETSAVALHAAVQSAVEAAAARRQAAAAPKS
jgi:AcrR family transcriptional regulator